MRIIAFGESHGVSKMNCTKFSPASAKFLAMQADFDVTVDENRMIVFSSDIDDLESVVPIIEDQNNSMSYEVLVD